MPVYRGARRDVYKRQVGDRAKTLGEQTGVNAAIGVAPTTMDFVNQAAISDMFQIHASSLALQRGDPATNAFAQQMITDHKKTSEELQGADFVKKYRSDMVGEHEAAVSLFQRYAAGGDNPALKDWAGKTLPTLQQHLAIAQKLS